MEMLDYKTPEALMQGDRVLFLYTNFKNFLQVFKNVHYSVTKLTVIRFINSCLAYDYVFA